MCLGFLVHLEQEPNPCSRLCTAVGVVGGKPRGQESPEQKEMGLEESLSPGGPADTPAPASFTL